nr:putative capsid [Marmot picobirnavirus]
MKRDTRKKFDEENRDAEISTPGRNSRRMSKYVPIVTKTKRSCGSVRGESNDSNWFKDSRGVVESAARIATYMPLGIGTEDLVSNSDDKAGIPTTFICEWLPTPALSESNTSGVSIAANVLFQQIRKVLNKPISDYSFADPIIAYTSFLSIMTLVEEIKRDYGIVNSYNTLNLGYPNLILQGLGYNPLSIVDLKNNMANYRNRFNTIMYELSTVYMPLETNIGEKYKWMARHIWVDHDSTKAQIYGYSMAGYYSWDETTSDQGSMAKFHFWNHHMKYEDNQLFKSKLDLLQTLIKQIRNSDSYNYLMSDMQRAFGDAASYTWESLEEDYTVVPSINDVMLNQFQNILTIPSIDIDDHNAAEFDITQDVTFNTILCKPDKLSVVNGANVQKVLEYVENVHDVKGIPANFVGTSPSEDDVIEILQTKVYSRFDKDANTIELHEDSFSCEIPMQFVCVIPLGTDTDSAEHVYYNTYNTISTNDEGNVLNVIGNMWMTSAFDWMPMMYWLTITGAEFITRPFVEADNLVRVPLDTFKLINKAEQLALWRVPEDVIEGIVR